MLLEKFLILICFAILGSTKSTKSCGCELMSSYFDYDKVETDPSEIYRTSILFTLHGSLKQPVRDVRITAVSSYCISGNCIPLDERDLECANESTNFTKGKVTISAKTEIPSYAPFGEYNVKMLYEGEINGKREQFACAETDFEI